MRFFVDFRQVSAKISNMIDLVINFEAAAVGADVEPDRSVVFSGGIAGSQLLRNTLSVSGLLNLHFTPPVSFVPG
jgi:hypothetical protein